MTSLKLRSLTNNLLTACGDFGCVRHDSRLRRSRGNTGRWVCNGVALDSGASDGTDSYRKRKATDSCVSAVRWHRLHAFDGWWRSRGPAIHGQRHLDLRHLKTDFTSQACQNSSTQDEHAFLASKSESGANRRTRHRRTPAFV